MIDIDNFKIEVLCDYKGETYSVRDNGAIMRHPKSICRVRPLDNKWTFGTKNKKNGYMFFASNVRVHQVVATAFCGQKSSEEMVVDHKDTNRCNNRAENLHWVTKLENVLNNPFTRRKIIYICGSVEAFLENPSLLQENALESNFNWMRTVSKEEALNCRSNLERWLKEDREFDYTSRGNAVDEWIFGNSNHIGNTRDYYQERIQISDSKSYPDSNLLQEENYAPLLIESLTSNSMQEDLKTPTEFPLCPINILSLEVYYSALDKGNVFSINKFGATTIIEAAISEDKKQLCIATHNPEAFKKWYITYVYIFDDKYIHKNGGSFFDKNGALRTITQFQGKEWTGGECFDDYC